MFGALEDNGIRTTRIEVRVGARAWRLSGRGEPSGPLIALDNGAVDERRIHGQVVARGADGDVPTPETPEPSPNKALRPTPTGAIMCRRGRTLSFGALEDNGIRTTRIEVRVGARAWRLSGRGEPSGPLIALDNGAVDERRIHGQVVARGADGDVPTPETPEPSPNKALRPTPTGAIMCRRGRTLSLALEDNGIRTTRIEVRVGARAWRLSGGDVRKRPFGHFSIGSQTTAVSTTCCTTSTSSRPSPEAWPTPRQAEPSPMNR